MLIPETLQSDLNEIRCNIMEKIAEGPAALVDYITFELINNQFNESDCEKFIKVASNGSSLPKPPKHSVKLPLAQGISETLGVMKAPLAIGTAFVAGAFALNAIKGAIDKMRANSVFTEILEQNKALKDDPKVHEYFETIKRFAPSVAVDRHVLETALQHAHEFGRLDYPIIKDLIQMQTGVVMTGPVNRVKDISGIARTVTGLVPSASVSGDIPGSISLPTP